MKITLNGTIVQSSCETLSALVRDQGLEPSCLVVELNRRVVRQEDWEGVSLKEGDVVELLNFVGGG